MRCYSRPHVHILSGEFTSSEPRESLDFSLNLDSARPTFPSEGKALGKCFIALMRQALVDEQLHLLPQHPSRPLMLPVQGFHIGVNAVVHVVKVNADSPRLESPEGCESSPPYCFKYRKILA